MGQAPYLVTPTVSSHINDACIFPSCPFKDPNAFCEDLSNGPAFRADDMEGRDGCCHRPIVRKRRTHLLICQHAAEPRLTTWTPGPHIWILHYFADVTQSTTVLFASQLL